MERCVRMLLPRIPFAENQLFEQSSPFHRRKEQKHGHIISKKLLLKLFTPWGIVEAHHCQCVNWQSFVCENVWVKWGMLGLRFHFLMASVLGERACFIGLFLLCIHFFSTFIITTSLPMRPFRIIKSYWWEWISGMPHPLSANQITRCWLCLLVWGSGFNVRFGHQMFIVWGGMVDGRGWVCAAHLFSVPDVKRFGTARCVFSLAQQGLLSAWAVQSRRCQLSLGPSVFLLSSSESGFLLHQDLKAKSIKPVIQMRIPFPSKDRLTYRKATFNWHIMDLLLWMTADPRAPFRDP